MSGRKEKAKRRWRENALLGALQHVASTQHKTQADKDAALHYVP